jgi:dsDNA-specific endonuclease/ATPase MutS2
MLCLITVHTKQVCKAVLESARPGALVLMDEMGSGTDPAQGQYIVSLQHM